jgi:ABC-type uncharacterized transport system permease subunit
MTIYIAILAIGLLIGFIAGVFFVNHLAVLAEQDRQNDIATGTPLASQLAREMKIKLNNYEEKELWV